VANCDECCAQVAAQRQARAALRTAGGPRLPASLMSALRSIPDHTDLPGAPADLAMSPDGQLVYRADPPTRPNRRPRDGHPGSGLRSRSAALPPTGLRSAALPAPALPPMLPPTALPTTALPPRLPVSLPVPRHEPLPAVGAPAIGTEVLDPPPADAVLARPAEHGRRPPGPRWFRFGTGVAMSGLALGALAFGATAASPTAPAPPTDRGVLGGSVLGGTAAGSPLLSPSGLVDARLQLGSRVDPGRTAPPRTLGSLRSLW
jgi:hypothetical protein